MTIPIAILGATGYGGGELLRLFLRRKDVAIRHATSRTEAGKHVSSAHRNLDGLTDLRFSAPTEAELLRDCEVVFSALPHTASAKALAPFIAAGKRVVDLSGDFRLRTADAYHEAYSHTHPHPELLADAVYGLPELHRERIRGARVLASPGCFATAIELALLPAARAGVLGNRLSVVAMTGSSGSGAEATRGTHHPTRDQTLRPYKVDGHQHCNEIVQTLGEAAGSPTPFRLTFTPVSAPLVRGILAIATAPLARDLSATELETIYEEAYAGEPFIKLVRDREPEPGPVNGTNYAEVRARLSRHGELIAMCAIDNLVKGGAGQAVQSFNIMMGLPETEGLDWPGTWP
ncbi:MAG: N-acetyl-gamma-glutamyl-phosphate reductase [Candidatus Sumerlaeia bacterium]|nr:N-acetyl-gamma-glutamyl-phosphate reductase [Candidatus Sumerlaeia bacterium]